MKVYRDYYYKIQEIEIKPGEDIFDKILAERENRWVEQIDKSFFIDFMPVDVASQYDFSIPSSVEAFREVSLTLFDNPLLKMGGYNMRPRDLKDDDIRYAGIKMSDPYGKVPGSFDIRNGIITYSPIWPHFYEERDLIKFANDRYFTTMTFEQIMEQQINKATSFLVHTGNYGLVRDIVKYGSYILEPLTREEMLEYVHNSEKGKNTLKRVRNKYMG